MDAARENTWIAESVTTGVGRAAAGWARAVSAAASVQGLVVGRVELVDHEAVGLGVAVALVEDANDHRYLLPVSDLMFAYVSTRELIPVVRRSGTGRVEMVYSLKHGGT